MIEVLNADTCTDCDLCVKVCPTNVFEATANGTPIIARQSSCQTCFMCEVYCPVDALYVDPDPARVMGFTVGEVEARGLFGGYRKAIGWTRQTRHLRSTDDHFRLPP